jgi:hypothetical protein
MTEQELTYDEYTVQHHCTLDGIQLDTPTAIKLYKKQGKVFQDLWQVLTKEIDIKDDFLNDIIKLVKDNMMKLWDENAPLTVQEILQNNNAEQRFYLLSQIDLADFEAISEVIDTQTVTKKQNTTVIQGYNGGYRPKFVDMDTVSIVPVTYEDTYTLLKVKKEDINAQNDVYIVKCKDTSTDRIYYLYVNGQESEAIRKDAITAIASTMVNPDGSIFTKEQYLALMAEA